MSESEEREGQEPEAAEPETAPEAAESEAPSGDAEPASAEAEAAAPEQEAAPEASADDEGQSDASAGEGESAENEAPEGDSPRQEQRSEKSSEEKKEVVPGADLEPIAIEDEQELTAEERAAREAEEEERRAREAAAAAADLEDEPVADRKVSVPADTHVQATGKRKSAVARVLINAGSGSFKINDRPFEEYFPSTQLQSHARQPLVTAGYDGSVDVRVRVHGGGISGQAGAVRHGLARALTALEPELRGELKRRGMLTRDDRRKERKKAGLKKARKRPQFSKR